jgi:hypothetical protein
LQGRGWHSSSAEEARAEKRQPKATACPHHFYYSTPHNKESRAIFTPIASCRGCFCLASAAALEGHARDGGDQLLGPKLVGCQQVKAVVMEHTQVAAANVTCRQQQAIIS